MGPANGWFTFSLFLYSHIQYSIISFILFMSPGMSPWKLLGKWHSAPKLNETVVQTVLGSIRFYIIKVTNIPSPSKKSKLSLHHCEMWFEQYFPGNDMMTVCCLIENEKVLYRLAFKFIIRQWDWWLRARKKMKQPKIVSQSVLITNLNSHLHSSSTWELYCTLRINLHMLFLLSHTTNNVLGVHFNAMYYHAAWNSVFCQYTFQRVCARMCACSCLLFPSLFLLEQGGLLP